MNPPAPADLHTRSDDRSHRTMLRCTTTADKQFEETLSTLRPITLEEINTRASLQTRIDRKYLLPTAELAEFITHLPGGSHVLHITGKHTQGYASCYLDTADLDSYHQAARGRRQRHKIRIRSYLASNTTVLETKVRGPRGSPIKKRIPIDTEFPTLDHPVAFGGLAPTAIEWLHTQLGRTELYPVLWGSYERSTILIGDGSGRLTIDRTVRFANPSCELVSTDMAVVETKSAHAPGTVDRQLWRAGFRPQRISKFGTGMAALNPELPHHRWRSVLSVLNLKPTDTPTPSERIGQLKYSA